jgi:hypothetical protein
MEEPSLPHPGPSGKRPRRNLPRCVGVDRDMSARLAIVSFLVTGMACSTASPPAPPEQVPGMTEAFDATRLVDVLGPDQIRSLDDPEFIPAAKAELSEGHPVVVVEIGDDARAFPLGVMTRHEIANTNIGGVAVSVTYCPLCNSAIVYDRLVGDRVLTFGVSGKLYQSDLVMFDRQTDSLWPQIMGRAVQGPLEGTELVRRASQILAFSEFREAFPNGRVVVGDLGGTYDFNPYEDYDSRDGPFAGFFEGDVADGARSNERVVGVRVGDEARAYPYSTLAKAGSPSVIHDEIGGDAIVIFWGGGARSALDDVNIEDAKVVGGSGVFDPRFDGRQLDFEVADGKIIDSETGSRWDLTGRATSGPLKGSRLEQRVSLDAFWFAWAAFVPFTEVWSG